MGLKPGQIGCAAIYQHQHFGLVGRRTYRAKQHGLGGIMRAARLCMGQEGLFFIGP